jgi:hypothetical protein
VNDVVSSMGVVFNKFTDIAPRRAVPARHAGVQAVVPDLRTAGGNELDPIPGFQGFRRVEPRNTPTMQAAGFNFDNFWDGRRAPRLQRRQRVRRVGPAGSRVRDRFRRRFGRLTPTRQIIKFASIASLATGPGLSEFEMSFLGRNWAKLGKKLLQAGSRRSPTSWSPAPTACWARIRTRTGDPPPVGAFSASNARQLVGDQRGRQAGPLHQLPRTHPPQLLPGLVAKTSAATSTAVTRTATRPCTRINAPPVLSTSAS